jgi:hypothetical protein
MQSQVDKIVTAEYSTLVMKAERRSGQEWVHRYAGGGSEREAPTADVSFRYTILTRQVLTGIQFQDVKPKLSIVLTEQQRLGR